MSIMFLIVLAAWFATGVFAGQLAAQVPSSSRRHSRLTRIAKIFGRTFVYLMALQSPAVRPELTMVV